MKVIFTILLLFTFFAKAGFDLSNNEEHPNISALKTEWNNEFIGIWVNENDVMPNITTCKIGAEDHQYIVKMWASCFPQDCDLGEKKSDGLEEGASKFDLLWDSGFAESIVTYEMVEGKLKLTTKRRFKDGSGRSDYTTMEYFVKN